MDHGRDAVAEMADMMRSRALYKVAPPELDTSMRVVASVNLVVGVDFPEGARHWSQLNPDAARLVQVFFNWCALAYGNKPWHAVSERPGVALHMEVLTDDEHVVSGYRLWLGATTSPVDRAVLRDLKHSSLLKADRQMVRAARPRTGQRRTQAQASAGDTADLLAPIVPDDEEGTAEQPRRRRARPAPAAPGDGDPDAPHPLLALPPPGTFLDELRLAHQLEAEVLHRRFEEMSQARVKEIFRTVENKRMPAPYDTFLKLRGEMDALIELAGPYYGYSGDLYAQTPEFRDAMKYSIRGDESAVPTVWRQALTAGDAFFMHLNQGHHVAAPYHTPALYYPRTFPAATPTIDLTRATGDTPRARADRHAWTESANVLRHRAAALFTQEPAPPMPERYPRPMLVFAMNTARECLAEMMLEQPLPLPLGKNAYDAARILATPADQLYNVIPDKIIAVYDRRTQGGGGGGGVPGMVQRLYGEELQADLRDVSRGDPDHMPGVATDADVDTSVKLMRLIVDDEEREERLINDTRRQELAGEIDLITAYIDTRLRNERTTVSERRKVFAAGDYPGALSRFPDDRQARQTRDGAESRCLVALGERMYDSDPATRTDEEAAGLADRNTGRLPNPGGGAGSTMTGASSLFLDPNGTYLDTFALQDAEARTLAEQQRYQAGSWGTIKGELLDQSAMACERIIIEAAYADFHAANPRTPDNTAEVNEKLERLRDRMVNRIHLRFFNIERESPAWVSTRNEVKRMIKSGLPVRTPLPQVLVNGNTFDSYITWFVNSVVMLGQIAPRNVQPALLAVLLSRAHMVMPDFTTTGEPSPNLMFEGLGGVGKSHIWKLVRLLMLPGSNITLAHMSRQAFLNGENYSYYLVMQDEMSPSIFIDPMDATSMARLPRGASNTGDSEKNAIFKQIITDRVATIAVTQLHKDTGERKTVYYHSLCIVQFFVATNISRECIAQAMDRRFQHHEFEQGGTGDAPQSYFRPKNLDAYAAAFSSQRRQHLNAHATHFYLEFYLNCGINRGDLRDEVCGTFLINKVFESLFKDFHVPAGQLAGTQHTQIRQIARALRIGHLVYQATSLELGFAVLDDKGVTVPLFTTAMFNALWRDQLVITEREVAYAVSLYGCHLVKDYERKIDMLLLEMMPGPLEVYPSALVGPPQQLVDLGWRAPTPGFHDLGAGRPGVDPEQPMRDERYLATEPFDSLEKLCERVEKKLMERYGKAIRKDTIKFNLLQRMRNQVDSPYYVARPESGTTVATLERTADGMRADVVSDGYAAMSSSDRLSMALRGTVPHAEIPCILWQEVPTVHKKKRLILCLARRYVVDRYSMTTTPYDDVYLTTRFRQQHPDASADMLQMFQQRMRQTASERMVVPAVPAAQAKSDDWIRAHGIADVIQDPVMGALNKVLRHARLHLLPGAHPPALHYYLVFTQPPSIRLVNHAEDGGGGGAVTAPVHFHTLMQRLEVQSAPDTSDPLRMINTQRPTYTSSLQMAAAAPPNNDTVGREMGERYALAAGMDIDMHPAMLQLLMLHEEFGQPTNGQMASLASKMGVGRVAGDLWCHPLNIDTMVTKQRDRLMARGIRKGWPASEIPVKVVYPFQDMRRIVDDALEQQQPRASGARSFPGMSQVLLRSPPVAIARPAAAEGGGGDAVQDADDDDAADEDADTRVDAMDLDE